jgi:hypothetical protein
MKSLGASVAPDSVPRRYSRFEKPRVLTLLGLLGSVWCHRLGRRRLRRHATYSRPLRDAERAGRFGAAFLADAAAFALVFFHVRFPPRRRPLKG